MNIDIENISERIIHARDTFTPLERLVEANDAPTIHDAMLIQHEIVRRRVLAGDKVVGFKLGNIAKAMQNKFGVGQPDFGPLLHSYFKPENLPLYADQFIQPYAELEPAFVLKKDLGGKYVTVADVISATDYVLPAIEIIDSRIKDWKIDIFETLADGGSVGAIILSAQPRTLDQLNLADTKGEIYFDDDLVEQGNTAAVYGNPVAAIMWLCHRVAEYGITFKKGDVILPGSCLAAVALNPKKKVTGRFKGWGEISFRYEPARK